MTDDHDTAIAGSDLGGQELEAAAVEMIGRFIEQQEVVVGAEKAGQAHTVTLPDRQLSEQAGHVGLRVEGFECDLNAPLSIPGVERFSMLQRRRILCGGGVGAISERVAGSIQPRQCGEGFGDRIGDGLSDSAMVGGIHLLLRQANRADSLHRATVGSERTGEHMQQGRFASSVLPDHCDARDGGEGEVDVVENAGGTSRHGDVGGDELRARARRKTMSNGVHASPLTSAPSAGKTGRWVREMTATRKRVRTSGLRRLGETQRARSTNSAVTGSTNA